MHKPDFLRKFRVALALLLVLELSLYGFCRGSDLMTGNTGNTERLFELAKEGQLSGELVSEFHKYARMNAKAKIQAPDEFWGWLAKNQEIERGLLVGLHPGYNPDVIKHLQQLRKAFGTQVEQYPHLALAFSFVYGAAKDKTIRSAWLKWTAEGRPVPSCTDSFAYYLENKDKMLCSLDQFPWPLMIYVADNDIPLSERQWVLNRHKKISTKTLGRLHTVPPYIKGTYVQSLPSICRKGGVCYKQAYYASRVMKCFGVPSYKIHVLEHIYEGWAIKDRQFKSGIGGSYGCHNGDFLCPLTRKILKQYRFRMLVSSINHSYDQYLNSKIACHVFKMLPASSKKQAIKLLEASIKHNPYVVDAWLLHVQACEEGLFPLEEGFRLFDRVCRMLPDYLVLRCTILNKLTAAQLKSKGDIPMAQCLETGKRFQDTLDWLIKKKHVDLSLGLLINHACYVARTKGIDVAVDHSLEWFELGGFSPDNQKELFKHVRSIAAKSNDKKPLEKLLLTEHARRRRNMLTCSKDQYSKHYSCYVQAAKANIDYYKKTGQQVKASQILLEIDRFDKKNLNLDDLRDIVHGGRAIGAIAQPVSTIKSFTPGCSVWRVLYTLPKDIRVRVYLQHAAAGKEGAFHLTAWSDNDHDGIPDTKIAMSPLMTAKIKDEWSHWDFIPTGRTVFVGLATKVKIPIYYQMNGELEGYYGLSDRAFYARVFDGKPEQTIQPRYSNLRVEILRNE